MAVVTALSGVSFPSFTALIPSVPSLAVAASFWLLSGLFEPAYAHLPPMVTFTGELGLQAALEAIDALIEEGELTQARDYLGELKATGCEAGYIKGRLGVIESSEGNTAGAIELFGNAIDACPPSDPFHHQTKIMLATLHMNRGDFTAAANILGPTIDEAITESRAATWAGDYERALDLAHASIEAATTPKEYPLGRPFHVGRAFLTKVAPLIGQGKLDEALEWAKRADQAFGIEDSTSYTVFSAPTDVMHASVLMFMEDDAGALELFIRAAEKFTKIAALRDGNGLAFYTERLGGENYVTMADFTQRMVEGGLNAIAAYREARRTPEGFATEVANGTHLEVDITHTRWR